MKKLLFLTFLLSVSISGFAMHEDPVEDKKKECADKKECAQKRVNIKKKSEHNTIYYSSIEGEALFIETVDKHRRPLSCILRINDEPKHTFVPEDGLVAFDKNKEVKVIHVFHDSKVYDFIPEKTNHNKLTLVLNTKNQKYHLYENRLRKINNENWMQKQSKGRMVSCEINSEAPIFSW